MKILFTSDLHGEEVLYRQVLDNARGAGAEVLVLGGDLLPSLQKAGRYEEMFREQRNFIDAFLLPFFRRGLETRFQRILLIPGNWDPAYPEIFAAPPEGLVDLDRKRFRFASGYGSAGVSSVGFKNILALRLSPSELMALAFSRLLLSPLQGTLIATSLNSALSKISAAIPSGATEYLQRLDQWFSVGLGPHKNYRHHRETIDILSQAIAHRHTVQMRYFSAGRNVTTRRKSIPIGWAMWMEVST